MFDVVLYFLYKAVLENQKANYCSDNRKLSIHSIAC